jgi:uncharacterized membrane protein (UPF0127 family)
VAQTRIVNRTRGTVLAARAGVARSFGTRLLGLMGRPRFPPGTGLLFPGTPWVHTCFVGFPVDLVFYGEGGVVLAVTAALPPWRFSQFHVRARGVAELPAGTAQATGTLPGDVLGFEVAP